MSCFVSLPSQKVRGKPLVRFLIFFFSDDDNNSSILRNCALAVNLPPVLLFLAATPLNKLKWQ